VANKILNTKHISGILIVLTDRSDVSGFLLTDGRGKSYLHQSLESLSISFGSDYNTLLKIYLLPKTAFTDESPQSFP